MSENVRLDTFDTGGFDKGAGKAKQTLWFFVNALLVKASWNPFMGVKIALLRAFGAKIGRGTVIKNNVCVKFPWKLEVGDNVWLGENAWIDNLDKVAIGNNVSGLGSAQRHWFAPVSWSGRMPCWPQEGWPRRVYALGRCTKETRRRKSGRERYGRNKKTVDFDESFNYYVLF